MRPSCLAFPKLGETERRRRMKDGGTKVVRGKWQFIAHATSGRGRVFCGGEGGREKAAISETGAISCHTREGERAARRKPRGNTWNTAGENGRERRAEEIGFFCSFCQESNFRFAPSWGSMLPTLKSVSRQPRPRRFRHPGTKCTGDK